MGRRADGEDRLRAILDATAALLRERPIAEISVADIAARAGVVRSGFYFYFPTKGAAVAAVLGDVSDQMLAGAAAFFVPATADATADVLGTGTASATGTAPGTADVSGTADGAGAGGSGLAGEVDGVAAIRASMWAGWRAWSAHRELILGVLDARGSDPGVREVWDGWVQRFVTAIGDEVARKRARGVAAGGGDPHRLVVVLTGAVERTFERLSRPAAEPDEAAGLVESLVEVWALAIFGTYTAPDAPAAAGADGAVAARISGTTTGG